MEKERPRGTIEEFERARRMSIPSWEKTKGMIELRTYNNGVVHNLFLNNPDLLREYYQKIYLAVLEGKKIRKPDSSDPVNRLFSYHFRIIRETVTGKIERPSKGWARRIRRQKALASK